MFKNRCKLVLISIAGILCWVFITPQAAVATGAHAGQAAPPSSTTEHLSTRPITVQDAIAMTRLADPRYFDGAPVEGGVAQAFSSGLVQLARSSSKR